MNDESKAYSGGNGFKTVTMRLAEEPFEKIKRGAKTVEIRLYDEKRKNIKTGDILEFLHKDKQSERLKAKVVALYRFGSFKELFASDLYEKTGTENLTAEEAAQGMYRYYTGLQEREYGVLAIEFILLT